MGDCVPFSSGSDTHIESGGEGSASGPHMHTQGRFEWREAPLRRARVLLVDDSRHDILLAKHYLIESGGFDCELLTAASANQAMETLLTAQGDGRPIDLILLDINMPGMDGFETLTRLREDAQLKGTHVVMCTGSTYDKDMERAETLGAAGYMLKPASLEQLRPMMTNLSGLQLTAEGVREQLMRVA